MQENIKIDMGENPTGGPMRLRVFTPVTITDDKVDSKNYNGFISYMDPDKKIEQARLVYNAPDEKLYIMSHKNVPPNRTEEGVEILANEYFTQWTNTDILAFIKMGLSVGLGLQQDCEIGAVLEEIPLPKGYYWLATILTSPEEQIRYEDFLVDPLVYDRLVALCKYKKLAVTEEMKTSSSLPIHSKEHATGEILVRLEVIEIFEQYCFANNFIYGFEEGTAEHNIGLIMRLVPKFAAYMFDHAVFIQQNPDVKIDAEGDQKEYNRQVAKALRIIEKDPSLTTLFENNLLTPEQLEK